MKTYRVIVLIDGKKEKYIVPAESLSRAKEIMSYRGKVLSVELCQKNT